MLRASLAAMSVVVLLCALFIQCYLLPELFHAQALNEARAGSSVGCVLPSAPVGPSTLASLGGDK